MKYLTLLLLSSLCHGQNAWTLRPTDTGLKAGLPVGRQGLYLFQEQTQGAWKGTVNYLRSTDGIVWAASSLPQSKILVAGGTRIVGQTIVGGKQALWYSDDGLAATPAALPQNLDVSIVSIATGAGKWVAVCEAGEILFSSDNAATWQTATSPAGMLACVVFGAGKFVATDGNATIISTDGARWTIGAQQLYSLSPMAFANGKFVSPYGSSASGSSWTESSNFPPDNFVGGDTIFVGWGDDRGVYVSSGGAWSPRSVPVISDYVHAVAFCGKFWLASTDSGKILTSATDVNPLPVISPNLNVAPAVSIKWSSKVGNWYQIQSSPDNQTWTNVEAPFPGTGSEIKWVSPLDQPKLFYRLQYK